MSASLQINGNITATDNATGTVALTKVLSSLITTASSFVDYAAGSVGSSPTSITLPASPTNFAYIKNLHATQTLTVTWTPNGGSSNPVVTLQPGSAVMLVENASGAGITALSLTGSGSSTTYEAILAG